VNLRLAWLFVLLALVLPSPGHAATMRYLDIAGLTAASDAVVRGRVVDARVFLGESSRITTEWTIHITAGWKNAPDGQIVVSQWVGELDGRVERIPGDARVAIGDDIVAFVRGSEELGWTFTALAQSIYQIVPGVPLLDAPPTPSDLAAWRGPVGWHTPVGGGLVAGRDLSNVVIYDDTAVQAVLREGEPEAMSLAALEAAIVAAILEAAQ
jgi:hypothetical protein